MVYILYIIENGNHKVVHCYLHFHENGGISVYLTLTIHFIQVHLWKNNSKGKGVNRYNGKTVRQEHMYVPRDMGWNCNELVGTECVHIFHHVLLFITPSLEWYLRKVCFTLRTFLDHDAVK